MSDESLPSPHSSNRYAGVPRGEGAIVKGLGGLTVLWGVGCGVSGQFAAVDADERDHGHPVREIFGHYEAARWQGGGGGAL
jgi:hypothetical protein